MIILDKDSYIAKGNCRHVFLYNDHCIKVALKETLQRRKNELKVKNKLKWLFKPLLRFYNENYNDVKFYNKFKNSYIYEYIPKFYGKVETNLGIGLEIEYLTDKKGSSLPTISKYIKNNSIDEKFIIALKEIWSVIIKNNIQIRAPHTDNFLVKDEDGLIKIYLIDGFYSANLIPILDYVPFLGRKKIKKKLISFLEFIAKEFPEYSKKFDIDNYKELL